MPPPGCRRHPDQPAVASQFFYGFHPELIAAPALVLALDAYRDGKLVRFLFWTFFMAFSKEVFTLAVGGILLVALMERRNWKWILLRVFSAVCRWASTGLSSFLRSRARGTTSLSDAHHQGADPMGLAAAVHPRLFLHIYVPCSPCSGSCPSGIGLCRSR